MFNLEPSPTVDGLWLLSVGEVTLTVTEEQGRELCAMLFAQFFLPEPGDDDASQGERMAAVVDAVQELVSVVVGLDDES